ncbi:MAG: glycosyltransferase family 4 protein [Simplicispira suum]|uniref:glycosyltransferase family 4 protein n=1 Tax=Simplicispira suum TaxID=2109915 RepID=UPI001C6BA8AE|nr:glycosyltransferase family 4 protein [Simplicispira suum]MBW7832191.1 glycosyltransferase family 4 protein [Simplicispira suum]
MSVPRIKPIRVLWTVNIVLPAVANELGVVPTPFGGWLTQMLEQMAALPDFKIGVAMRSPLPKLQCLERSGITYYALPQLKKNISDVSDADCLQVVRDFSPDIMHAHGSEMPYTKRFLRNYDGPKILSLQGVINGIAPYQLGRMSIVSMLLNPLQPRRVAIALALILNERFRFRPRLRAERETFLLANYVIGRTVWDHAHTIALNPVAQYLHCGEILRSAFYAKTWSIDRCRKKSIFIGNSSSPLKGAHIAVRALALLRRDYPDVKLFFAGPDPRSSSKLSLRGQFGYQAYLLSLIEELGLENQITFTGQLAAEEMASRMCDSNVYLLPSLIENSPNTLGEAMAMGVPSVAAYVGGVPSIAADEKEALLYRADDPVMLAFQVRRLFDDDALCERLAVAARLRAAEAYDPLTNRDLLVAAYRLIGSQASV